MVYVKVHRDFAHIDFFSNWEMMKFILYHKRISLFGTNSIAKRVNSNRKELLVLKVFRWNIYIFGVFLNFDMPIKFGGSIVHVSWIYQNLHTFQAASSYRVTGYSNESLQSDSLLYRGFFFFFENFTFEEFVGENLNLSLYHIQNQHLQLYLAKSYYRVKRTKVPVSGTSTHSVDIK